MKANKLFHGFLLRSIQIRNVNIIKCRDHHIHHHCYIPCHHQHKHHHLSDIFLLLLIMLTYHHHLHHHWYHGHSYRGPGCMCPSPQIPSAPRCPTHQKKMDKGKLVLPPQKRRHPQCPLPHLKNITYATDWYYHHNRHLICHHLDHRTLQLSLWKNILKNYLGIKLSQ